MVNMVLGHMVGKSRITTVNMYVTLMNEVTGDKLGEEREVSPSDTILDILRSRFYLGDLLVLALLFNNPGNALLTAEDIRIKEQHNVALGRNIILRFTY